MLTINQHSSLQPQPQCQALLTHHWPVKKDTYAFLLCGLEQFLRVLIEHTTKPIKHLLPGQVQSALPVGFRQKVTSSQDNEIQEFTIQRHSHKNTLIRRETTTNSKGILPPGNLFNRSAKQSKAKHRQKVCFRERKTLDKKSRGTF